MSFFKRKIEELQTKRAERENLKEFGDIFRKSLGELRSIFASDPSNLQKQLFSTYPKPIYQGDIGVNAFGLVHHVQPHQFPALLNLVRQGREEVSYFHFVRELDGHSLHTLLSPTWRFSERDVRLLSNDVELIATLSKQGFHPPPPWITLYEIGPVLYVGQGEPHFWLNYVWDPFWENLSLDEQDDFLQESRKETASYISDENWEDWVLSIRMRDVRYRKREQ